MKTSTNARREKIRLQIVRGAASAFRKSGYHATNMNQIADAVNMTKSNLYNYFTAKEDILFFCHQYGMIRLVKLLDRINATSHAPEVKLRRLITGFVHLMNDELDGQIMSVDLKELTGTRLRRVVAMRDKVDKGMRRIIANGIRSASFRQVDTKLVSFTIFGAMNWIPRWFNPHGSAESVEISNVVVDCIFNGILNKNARRSRG
jgi:AcrR family transcriptional regulator